MTGGWLLRGRSRLQKWHCGGIAANSRADSPVDGARIFLVILNKRLGSFDNTGGHSIELVGRGR